MENWKIVSKSLILLALTSLPNLVSGTHSSSPPLNLRGAPLGPPYLGGPSLLPLPVPRPNPLFSGYCYSSYGAYYWGSYSAI